MSLPNLTLTLPLFTFGDSSVSRKATTNGAGFIHLQRSYNQPTKTDDYRPMEKRRHSKTDLQKTTCIDQEYVFELFRQEFNRFVVTYSLDCRLERSIWILETTQCFNEIHYQIQNTACRNHTHKILQWISFKIGKNYFDSCCS